MRLSAAILRAASMSFKPSNIHCFSNSLATQYSRIGPIYHRTERLKFNEGLYAFSASFTLRRGGANFSRWAATFRHFTTGILFATDFDQITGWLVSILNCDVENSRRCFSRNRPMQKQATAAASVLLDAQNKILQEEQHRELHSVNVGTWST
jgi:hypothetical protein